MVFGHSQLLFLAAAFFGDLHEFNIAANTWTDLSSLVEGVPPAARDRHGFASVGGKLYVYGGRKLIGVLLCPASCTAHI